ncbi:Hypothetical predicted protein [Cloeon dipterum]|uniref:Uncharacterized protein n=1 Tax=Cloeon dipterum TaxID=197152 RepID=A0A8S1DJN2_9INSE|nr:Hypothetical predicted protein [Cloeon dipterum]
MRTTTALTMMLLCTLYEIDARWIPDDQDTRIDTQWTPEDRSDDDMNADNHHCPNTQNNFLTEASPKVGQRLASLGNNSPPAASGNRLSPKQAGNEPNSHKNQSRTQTPGCPEVATNLTGGPGPHSHSPSPKILKPKRNSHPNPPPSLPKSPPSLPKPSKKHHRQSLNAFGP